MASRSSSPVLPALTLVFLALFPLSAGAGTIATAWDPVADPDVTGYRVFFGKASGVYDQQLDVGLSTQQTLTGLTDCTTYFVAVKAFDGAGNFSVNFSNEVSGWPRPTLSGSVPAGAEQGRQLDVAFTGTNFQNGAAVSFDNPGITVNSVVVNSCGQLVASITIAPGAAVGTTTVEIANPDQTFGTGAGLFRVEGTVPPTVTGVSPADGATGLLVTVQPSVTFSEPMDPLSVTAATLRLLDSAGNPTAQSAGSPSLSPDGLTATIVPATDLLQGETYRVEVQGGTGGAQDLAGHPLDATFTQATGFATVADTMAPVISQVASGATGATSTEITWTTDEATDSQVFYRLAGQTFYQQTDVDPNQVTSHTGLVQGLRPDSRYEYHVRSADGAGNEALSSPDLTFTTMANSNVYLTFEAEAGALTAPVRAVAGPDAFAGAWIDTPAGTTAGTTTSPSGTATFGVNLPSAGTWYVWIRLFGATTGSDGWFQSVDGAARQTLFPSVTGTWKWTSGGSFILDAGVHTLELGGREPEARADRVLVTDDPDFVPTEQPVGDTSSPAAATGFAASASSGMVALSWTNPWDPDLERVVIRYSTDGRFPVSPVDGLPLADGAAAPGDAGTFTHQGLLNGTTYSYSLFAVDRSGNVSQAAQTQATPLDNVPPGAVMNLRRTDVAGAP
ncbi:MAG: Ig-like domain-containing protein [Acidobacteriota bacterium]